MIIHIFRIHMTDYLKIHNMYVGVFVVGLALCLINPVETSEGVWTSLGVKKQSSVCSDLGSKMTTFVLRISAFH